MNIETEAAVSQRRPQRRTLISCAVVALVVTAVLQLFTWQGNQALHTTMEIVATLTAAFVGVLAFVRYYARKDNTYLFLATGFVGTALLDGYHALVTSSVFVLLMPSPPESLIPWSWNASRSFLAVLMVLTWLAAHWERKSENTRLIHAGWVYVSVASLTVVSFCFFAFVPLPRAYYPDLIVGRPEELIAAVFFAIAMIGFGVQVNRRDSFHQWLVWSLVVGFVLQAAVMSRSSALFDLPFDLAHSLKIVSYGLVLTGLLVSVYQTFEEIGEARDEIRHSRDELSEQISIAEQLAMRAEAANRAKSDFLANMSHEIRTPMTAILGYVDLLAEDGDITRAPESRLETIHTIRSNANHLLTVINDVLDMARIEAGNMSVNRQELSPVELVEDVCSLMQGRAEGKGIELKCELASGMPDRIFSDPGRLRQILLNLTGNAIKFTETGSVTLRVSCEVLSTGSHVMKFAVKDTGIGMSMEQTELVSRFDAFSQADSTMTRRFGGSGLGLRISNSLAELLGGGIRVESIRGQGSTFTLTIDPGDLSRVPLVNGEVARREIQIAKSRTHQKKPSTPQQSKPLDRLRILFAEDGPDNQRLVSFILKKAGADVTLAGNGQIAIDTIHQNSEQRQQFDVVLMDMQMPELDGYAATQRLRSEGYDRPIIALTAHALDDDRQKCLDAGCDEFATKPVDKKELISLIAEFVERTTASV